MIFTYSSPILAIEDFVSNIFIASTHSYILIFTDRGRVYWLKVHEIPEVGPQGKGKAVSVSGIAIRCKRKGARVREGARGCNFARVRGCATRDLGRRGAGAQAQSRNARSVFPNGAEKVSVSACAIRWKAQV